MKRKYIVILTIVSAIILFFILFKTFRLSLFSVVSSWVTPIDNEYIINEAEWLSNSRGGIIRFDDASFILKNDTIYYEGKPEYVVTRLNKYFNEITIKWLKTGEKTTLTSTSEFTK